MTTASPPSPASDAPTDARLARAYFALAGLVYGLIVLGALVRAHGAGLACPDWPLCFGQLVPSFDLRVAFEWGHRAVAGTVSLAFLGLGIAVLRRPALRRRAARRIVLGAVILAVQIVLGGLTVLHLLASWTVTSHLLTGNAFAVSVVFIGLGLREEAPSDTLPGVTAALRAAVSACLALLVVQLALGGLVASNYAGLTCPDWPTCIGGEWWPSGGGPRQIQLLHRATAYTLVLSLLATAALSRSGPPHLARLLWIASAVGLSQVGVGVANVLLRLPVEITGLHSALAAALTLLLALAAREVWRARLLSVSR